MKTSVFSLKNKKKQTFAETSPAPAPLEKICRNFHKKLIFSKFRLLVHILEWSKKKSSTKSKHQKIDLKTKKWSVYGLYSLRTSIPPRPYPCRLSQENNRGKLVFLTFCLFSSHLGMVEEKIFDQIKTLDFSLKNEKKHIFA